MVEDFSFEESRLWQIFILLFNVFSWFFMTLQMIDDIVGRLSSVSSQNFVWASYYLVIVVSSIFGAIIDGRLKRFYFLLFWVILGVVSPLLITFAIITNILTVHALTICIFLGLSFGLGMPSCLSYFSEQTSIEHRGRLSGVIFVTANLSAPLLGISVANFGLMVSSLVASAWRGIGLIFLLFPKQRLKKPTHSEAVIKNVSFSSVIHDKSFLLYFIAWLMFCSVDRLETPVFSHLMGDFYYLAFGPIIGSISALVGGLLADIVGRKGVVLYSFVTLGVAYAIIGVAPHTPLDLSWYLHLTMGSVATGMLWVTFILIIWGDLAKGACAVKYYALGEIPFFLSAIIELVSSSYVGQIPVSSAFSFASFFIFLAVLPLLYAPETLPERKIELRRLRRYVEEAKKVKEKYVGKEPRG